MVKIQTDRLILRQSEENDTSSIIEYLKLNEDFHRPYEPIRPKDSYDENYWLNKIKKIEDDYNKHKALWLLIFFKKNPNKIMGTIHFSSIYRGPFQACHLGYMLDEQAQSHGYMSEGLKAAIDFMFKEKKIRRIMANYIPTNHRSANLLKNLGFKVEGEAKEYLRINGEWQDHILTSLINKNWCDTEAIRLK